MLEMNQSDSFLVWFLLCLEEEDDFVRRLILKRINKIFKKSYESNQILNKGDEVDLNIR